MPLKPRLRQGAASAELATTLFDLLPTQPGSEEDIVTLLSSVCGKLAKETPLTPTALRAVVDVIRHTNKQTHRHALHQVIYARDITFYLAQETWSYKVAIAQLNNDIA